MPKPLFSKLIAQAAVGFFCVLIGCVCCIRYHDHVLLLMSILIGIFSLIRCIQLYWLIHTKSYLIFEGTCTKREWGMLKKKQRILFTDAKEREYSFTVDKSVKLLQGHRYRLYFRLSAGQGQASAFEDNAMPELLGHEEISLTRSTDE